MKMVSDTPEKILQTARRLFIQQGYTATSMRQIAEETGIGKATIYHHFPDKEAIIMALLEDSVHSMEETLTRVRAERDPRRRLQAAAESSIEFLLNSADILQIVRREAPAGRDEFQSRFLIFSRDFLRLLEESLQQGIDEKIFRAVEPQQAARVFLTMIQGTFAMAYLTGAKPQSPRQAAAALLDIYYQGIECR